MKATTRPAAFTIMEIMVVVAVIGILAAIAVPAFFRSAKRTMIGVQESDLRSFDRAFSTFELEKEYFPPSHGTAGEFPDEMEDYMPTVWKQPAPIGGAYTWINSRGDTPEERIAYIRISGSAGNPIALTREDLIKLDKKIDDGNTSTGRLILSGLSIRFYITQ